MDSPTLGITDLPPMNPSSPPPNQSALTPHYIIAAQEVAADLDSPLGATRRTGSVFKGSWNNSLVAIKVLSNTAPVDTLLECIKTWQILRHPHVLQVFGISSLDADPPFIISQYYPNGNANEFLSKNPGVDRAKIMFESALGMQYLHGRGLVHGSLKPSNILVAENGQACVADYGMTALSESGSTGAHRYFSPEAWKGTTSRPSDVFAFAMSSYEIFMSAPPWGVLSENRIYQLVVREDDRPDRPEPDFEAKCGLTDRIWEIMEAAWQKDAKLRPTFTQIVELWQNRSIDGDQEITRPPSPTTSVADSSFSLPQPYHFRDSQSTLGGSQSWQSNQNPDSISILGMPPAYGDLGTRRPLPSWRAGRSHSVLSDQTFNTSRSTSSIVSRSLSLPTSTGRRPIHEDLTPPSTATSFDSNAWSSLTSDPPQLPLMRQPSTTSVSTSYSARLPRMSPIDESASSIGGRDGAYHSDSEWLTTRPLAVQGSAASDANSVRSGSQRRTPSITGPLNAVLLAGALNAEVAEGRKQEVIDDYLHRTQILSSQSDKEAQKLVTAGVVPTVILLLKSRAVDGVGLEIVLVTLGILACDPITSNTIYRTNTTSTLIEIINASDSDDIIALSVWCINRICRSSEVAAGLIKQDLATVLIRKGLRGGLIASRLSAWCLGALVHTDALAETLAAYNVVTASVDHLRDVTADLNSQPEDRCAAIYLIARLARTIQLSKSLARAGCMSLIVQHLSGSENPSVLNIASRAVGCLMRPNSSDMAKALLDAGTAKALARLPRVLPSEVIEPLASFAFAIQRLSCAEWGGGTRKALVDAGVVDSLLAALRTSADEPYPGVHIELALAVSFLGDVGGTSIRKEIVKAGGIDILKRVSVAGEPEVTKACNLAITSITGNLWSRNAASAKTAMAHNWNGGCPEYQPACPVTLTVG